MTARPFANRIRAAWLVLLAGLAGGCACGPHGGCGHQGGAFFAGSLPVCFGYSSTCWHAWPAECVGCPAYTVAPKGVEILPMLDPSVRPAAPALPPTPAPDEQAQYAPPPPVLIAAPDSTIQAQEEPAPLEPPTLALAKSPLPPAQNDVEQVRFTPLVEAVFPASSPPTQDPEARFAPPLPAVHVPTFSPARPSVEPVRAMASISPARETNDEEQGPAEPAQYQPPPPVLTLAPIVTPASLHRARSAILSTDSP